MQIEWDDIWKLRYIVTSICKGWQIAGHTRADLVQDCLLTLGRIRHKYDPAKGSLEHWVRITTRARLHSLSLVKKHRMQQCDEVQTEDGILSTEDLLPSRELEPAENLIAAEEQQQMWAQLQQWLAVLSPLERDVIGTVALGHTHEQTAQILGIKPKQVDNALQRAREKISACFGVERCQPGRKGEKRKQMRRKGHGDLPFRG